MNRWYKSMEWKRRASACGLVVLSATCLSLLSACSATGATVTTGTAANTGYVSPAISASQKPETPANYVLGTKVTVPQTIGGIVSVTVYGFYPNVQSTQPDVDTPPAGDTYAAIDAEECAGSGGSSMGANESDFTVLLSNGSTANQDTLAGSPNVSQLSAESELGSSNASLAAGQCDRGWIVFDIPKAVTPTFVQFSGTTASFTQGNSVVKWSI